MRKIMERIMEKRKLYRPTRSHRQENKNIKKCMSMSFSPKSYSCGTGSREKSDHPGLYFL
jgi:hypothetical protein